MNSIPYTYLIGWSKFNKWYYGVRFAKGCNPGELWNTYFTSSNTIKKFTAINGAPDIITIRKIFSSVSHARNWEHKVLRRMKVTQREDFLNQTDNKSIVNTSEHYKILGSYIQKGKKKNFTPEDLIRRSKLQTAMNMSLPRDGSNNGRFDSNIYTFMNRKTGETFTGYRYDFCRKYDISPGNVCSMLKGNLPHTKQWIRTHLGSPLDS